MPDLVQNGTVSLVLVATQVAAIVLGLQDAALTREEIAAHRLAPAAFARFERASRAVASEVARDPALVSEPLFSQEIAQGGDVAEVAATLEQRLSHHAGLSRVLKAASLTPREYTKFALSLVAARLAFGFVESGLLKSVPAGTAADNVAFVRAHRAEVDAVLDALGVEFK